MKTDSQLQRDVLDELSWEPEVEHAHIGVAANQGVIALTGHVPSYLQKITAERAAKRVNGVKAVAEEIEVHFAFDPKTSDDEIAARIVQLFKWDISVPDDRIQVVVSKGLVTLTGEVDWNFQKVAAKAAAARIGGVKSVYNAITVRARVSAGDVRDRIMSAIKRSSALDAASINVSVEGGTVKLSGNARGWNERRIAENAAWAAPGVTRVVDEIMFV